MTPETFDRVVDATLVPAFDKFGLVPYERSPFQIRFKSDRVNLSATFDPRGELDIDVVRVDEPTDRWSYMGMTGRADFQRLCEIALLELQTDTGILAGDPAAFEAARSRATARRHLP